MDSLEYLERNYSQIFPYKEDKIILALYAKKVETGFCSFPGKIVTFSSLIMFEISEIRILSFYAVLLILKGSSTGAYFVSVSLILYPFLTHQKRFL